jgi:hypothetical protein
MKKVFLCVLLALGFAFGGPIDNLKAGEWYEAPNSHLASVPPGGNVIAPWSGGAFDTQRNQLIVWGGGHGDYAGNEVYAFNLDSLKWFRLTDPSSITGYAGGCANILPDSQPVSRHTYAGMDYVASADKIFSGGGFTWPNACGDPVGWLFDYTLNKWVVSAIIGYGSRGMSGYDPVAGKLWVIGGTGTGFRDFNGATGVWTSHNNPGFMGQIITVDPDDRLLVGLNKGNINTYTLNGTGTAAVHATSGDTAAINAAMPDGDYKTPGFVWDPVLKCFVAWNGGADVYTLNLTTYSFTRVGPAVTNTVIPTAAAAQGTYGRFRYSPKNNVYVVVNSISENVFLYRLTGGTSAESAKIGRRSPAGSFSVSPNPVRGGAVLSMTGAGKQGTFIITDIAGKRIAVVSAQSGNGWRVPQDLAPGLYLAKWAGMSGESAVKPFVSTR